MAFTSNSDGRRLLTLQYGWRSETQTPTSGIRHPLIRCQTNTAHHEEHCKTRQTNCENHLRFGVSHVYRKSAEERTQQGRTWSGNSMAYGIRCERPDGTHREKIYV